MATKMIGIDVERLLDRLNESDCIGGQLAVTFDGNLVVDEAFGFDHLGAPMTNERLMCSYCTGKPVLALAILAAIERNELGRDDAVRRWLPEADGSWIGDLTVQMLLDHRAGLHRLPAVIARITPERSRFALVLAAPLPPNFTPGEDAEYSEISAWYLLGKILERARDRPYWMSIDELILQKYLSDPTQIRVGIRGDNATTEMARIACSVGDTDKGPIPLLAESGSRTTAEWNPAFGYYTSARGLNELFTGVLADLNGANRVLRATTLGRLIEPGTSTHSPSLERNVRFADGFMVGLNEQSFGRSISARSFGHTGQGGVNFVAVDVDRRITISCRTIRLMDRTDGVNRLRPLVVDTVLEELGADR